MTPDRRWLHGYADRIADHVRGMHEPYRYVDFTLPAMANELVAALLDAVQTRLMGRQVFVGGRPARVRVFPPAPPVVPY